MTQPGSQVVVADRSAGVAACQRAHAARAFPVRRFQERAYANVRHTQTDKFIGRRVFCQ
jgi:hypothetical protein